jgi:hypothetical protein
VDVLAFVSLLLAIVAESQPHRTAFVSKILDDARSPKFARTQSLANIFGKLKSNHFQVVARVDSDEVAAFVGWVESSEETGKWE